MRILYIFITMLVFMVLHGKAGAFETVQTTAPEGDSITFAIEALD